MEKLIQDEMIIRKEIISNFDKNYLLEAGAGAGKTTIIVERIITHIIDGSIEPKNIVAITFTKAASLELAERIQGKALDYLSMEEYSHVKDRLERVEEIFTGTIHSFCELLLREMPFEAGLTPGYEIIEDSEKFYEKIWYEFLREFEDDYKEDIKDLNQFNVDYRELKESAFVAMDNPDINFLGFKDNTNYLILEKRFNNIDTSVLDASFIKAGSNLGKLLVSIIEDKRDLGEYIDEILLECAKLDDNEDLASKYIYKKYLKSDGVDDIVDFIESIMSIYRDINSIVYNMCTNFINRVVDYRKRRYTNSLTFNDLLFRSSKLIKGSEDARKHFRKKFKSFYIDEAQDTDPIQAELLLLLSHDGDIEKLKSLEDISPRRGSLFIVGDPKQSIYRFRRADITIYETVKRVISSSKGEVVYLDINFRSNDSICNWVEKTFKDRSDGFAFSEKPTLVQAGFEKILSLWKSKKEIDEKKDKFSGVYGYEFSDDIGIREEEYIAALVEDMIKNGFIDEKLGKNEIETRRIQNKDIMILTKSNEETGIYLNELKKRNISSLLGGEKRLGDTREVLNLFLLIDFLVDFKDNIKLTAMLKNSFNLEFETIDYLLRTSDIEDMILDKERIKDLSHPHLKEVFFHLQEMFMGSKTAHPITFIEMLIKNKQGIYHVNKAYNGLEKRDADSALFQTLELLKSKNPISLYNLREELRNIIDEKVNYELPLDFEFSQNAVRIMNIHKAKGLEANIVILVGSSKRRTTGSDSHYIEKKDDRTEGYMVYKKKLLVQGPDEQIRKNKEREFKEAELDRLIYVAATRSKTVLILPSVDDEKLFLAPIANNFREIIDVDKPSLINTDEGFTAKKLEEIEITKSLIKKESISRPSYLRINPSKVDDNFIFKIEEDREMETNIPRGSMYGDMVHRAFELILKDIRNLKQISKKDKYYAINNSIGESLEDLEITKDGLDKLFLNNTFNIDNQIDIGFKEEDIKNKVKEILFTRLELVVDSFFKNEDISDIFSSAKSIFTEFPFEASIDPSFLPTLAIKGQLIVVNGVIDLLIEMEDDSFIIIDYKTNIVSRESYDEDFRKRYKEQLKIYKIILEEVLDGEGVSIDNIFIYSTYLDKLVALEEKVEA